MADQYYPEPMVLNFEKGTVKIWRPILTEEERAKRLEEVKKACKKLGENVLVSGVEILQGSDLKKGKVAWS